MSTPHASWAHLYDFAYENGHGELYQRLTDHTIATIQELRPSPCSVVDFGAGTGRLAIPLARRGYKVTAVDPCREMMDVLAGKARNTNVEIEQQVERMQDFGDQGRFDIALCVFTTVLYLLDEASLRQGLFRFVDTLKTDGRLLIDIPQRQVFKSYRRLQPPVLDRNVTITPAGGDLHTYHEEARCLIDGAWQEYRDTFSIRYWPVEAILTILRERGVVCEGPIPGFQGTGADYYSGTKPE